MQNHEILSGKMQKIVRGQIKYDNRYQIGTENRRNE